MASSVGSHMGIVLFDLVRLGELTWFETLQQTQAESTGMTVPHRPYSFSHAREDIVFAHLEV